MKGVDQIVAWARAWAHSTTDNKITLTDFGGKAHHYELHKDWTVSEWLNLVGRVADLKKAYKQLPSSRVALLKHLLGCNLNSSFDFLLHNSFLQSIGRPCSLCRFLIDWTG